MLLICVSLMVYIVCVGGNGYEKEKENACMDTSNSPLNLLPCIETCIVAWR